MPKKIDEMLNPKQLDFMLSEDKRINLLTGSVRSGKTYISLSSNVNSHTFFSICSLSIINCFTQ